MNRLVSIICFITFVCCVDTAHAQTTQDSIKQTINQLFTAMKEGDAAALEACFADSAVLQTIVYKEGKTTIHNEEVKEFSSFVANLQNGDADEQVTYDVIKTDSELAIVWAPYKFYWKGKFSHCGADSFQLVRINGAWKIVYLIDTRRNENCE